MPPPRRYTVNDVLDILEENNTFQRADVFIEPPPVDMLTDEDSGDEEERPTVENLNGRQLSASATATIILPDGRQTIGEENQTIYTEEEAAIARCPEEG
ncbi:hypothetical protein V1264_003223 [Littorina saxatilis]|uniref:Uncharacterized protein n=1 Tax=Littorina saxatilis TaxID=31220 RepID=A0AAN9B4Z1_9CAEN